MGEAKRKRSATEKLIAQFPVCYFCGKRPSVTREHMPPKSLFDNSHRPDKLILPACKECNRDTSAADLVAALVSRWSYKSPKQTLLDHKKLSAQMHMQAPKIISEWLAGANSEDQRKGRQHLLNHGVPVPFDAAIATIGPETIKQLNLFAHKAMLALYFEHFKKPLPLEGRLFAFWKTKEDFARDGIPPLLLQMMGSYGALIQGKWNTSETFEYRYSVNHGDGLFGCLAKLREGLFVGGFAVSDANILPPGDADWIAPDDPDMLLGLPRFLHKL